MSRAVIRQSLFAVLFALPLAAAQPMAVRVVEPADGAVLTGGSTAVIRWSGALDAERDIEEWEAFLSVDGGRYYSVRITPHLDVSIREFRWSVPNVASNDVRLLIRFGNEKDERAIELPLALAIDPVPAGCISPGHVSAPGEAARPGDPGVVQWTEGDRRGAHLAQVAVSIPSVAAIGVYGVDERSAIETGVSVLSFGRTPVQARQRRQVRALRRDVPLASDVLLRCTRLNI